MKHFDYRIRTHRIKSSILLQIHTSGADGVHTVQTLDNGDGTTMSVDLNSVAEATLNQDGQIILTGEDGQGT